MRKILLPLFFLLISNMASAQNFDVAVLSHRFLYVYVMGSWIHNTPADDEYISESSIRQKDSFGPVLGIGYTIVDYKKRVLLNLEFDYATAEFTFAQYPPERVHYYNFFLNLEYRFPPRIPLGFYLGVGFAFLRYDSGLSETDEFPVATNMGIKVLITRRIFLKADFRHYWDYDITTDYYYTEYWDSYGSAVSLGLEYHF